MRNGHAKCDEANVPIVGRRLHTDLLVTLLQVQLIVQVARHLRRLHGDALIVAVLGGGGDAARHVVMLVSARYPCSAWHCLHSAAVAVLGGFEVRKCPFAKAALSEAVEREI